MLPFKFVFWRDKEFCNVIFLTKTKKRVLVDINSKLNKPRKSFCLQGFSYIHIIL